MQSDREAGLTQAVSIVAGFGVVALTNAIAIAVFVPRSGSVGLRAAYHFFDAAEVLGVGAALGALIGLWVAYVRAPLWASLTVYAGLATTLVGVILGPNLERQAQVAFDGRMAAPLFVLYLAATGLGIPAAHVIGALLSRFRLLWIAALVAALGGIVVNHLLLQDDYPDVHGIIGWGAATLSGAALGPPLVRAISKRWSRRARVFAGALVAVIALAGLVIPPSNRVRLELFREPGAMGAWLLASTIWRLPEASPPPASAPNASASQASTPQASTSQASTLSAATDPETSAWFADRSAAAPVPPSTTRLIAGAPVVVLITIDAVRADVIADPRNEKIFPTIARMKRRGAYFTFVTSPGAQTAVSLTALFSGRYFSELFWSMHGRGSARFVYAHSDPAPRFPALLTASGVRTFASLSVNFLASDFGVVRGFGEELMVAEGRKHAIGASVVDPLIERLENVGPNEPAFFYAHLTEPHAPYDRGTTKGSDKDRYISEIGVADKQLARIAKVLSTQFPSRGVLMVSSDHGEAFGEHGTINHTKTLYEELLRVPLLVAGAGVRAKPIAEHAALLDIGPTILDIFGISTPGTYMGQSLVPLLHGDDVSLQRPIFAEGRLRRAYYHGYLKVIEDSRRKVIEAYDLVRDPLEADELFSKDPARVEPALAALRAFFEAHEARAPGYEAPYKP